MKKYKVCPVCGVHNHPLYLECSDCEADLQNIPVVDEETEQAAAQSGPKTNGVTPPAPMVRICDCGAKNPVQVRRCTACGEDISTVIPTADAAAAVCRYVLSSLDGAYAYEIPEGSTLIGREQEMHQYLAAKPYVSRKHAQLHLNSAEGILTIQNCSTTNYTFVNNRMISSDQPLELKDGDEVGLGGNGQDGSRQPEAAYFTVRIGSCT